MPATETIRISEDNKRTLHDLKDMGQSYDEVVEELIEAYWEQNRQKLFADIADADERTDEFVPLEDAGD